MNTTTTEELTLTKTTTVDDPTVTDHITQSRELIYRWERPEVEADGRRCVELTVRHAASRKAYVASMHIIDVHPGYVMATIAPGHFMTVASQPVARHSAKALRAFAVEALDALNLALNNGDSRAEALFAGRPFQR